MSAPTEGIRKIFGNIAFLSWAVYLLNSINNLGGYITKDGREIWSQNESRWVGILGFALLGAAGLLRTIENRNNTSESE